MKIWIQIRVDTRGRQSVRARLNIRARLWWSMGLGEGIGYVEINGAVKAR